MRLVSRPRQLAPRRGPRPWRGGAILAALLAAGPLAAQIPGDELPSQARVRNEYLASTYGDVKQVLADWTEHHRSGDMARLARLFTEDALYSPVDGWYAQGKGALADSIGIRLTRMKNYSASLIDFTASGGLAYYLGRMSYQLRDGADVSGTFVMVFYLAGRHWRIRSYIERPVGGF